MMKKKFVSVVARFTLIELLVGTACFPGCCTGRNMRYKI